MKQNISAPAQKKTASIVNVETSAENAKVEAAIKRTLRKFDNLMYGKCEGYFGGEKIIDSDSRIEKLLNRISKRIETDKKEIKKSKRFDDYRAAKRTGLMAVRELQRNEAVQEATDIYKKMEPFVTNPDITDEQVEIFFAEIKAFIQGYEEATLISSAIEDYQKRSSSNFKKGCLIKRPQNINLNSI